MSLSQYTQHQRETSIELEPGSKLAKTRKKEKKVVLPELVCKLGRQFSLLGFDRCVKKEEEEA